MNRRTLTAAVVLAGLATATVTISSCDGSRHTAGTSAPATSMAQTARPVTPAQPPAGHGSTSGDDGVGHAPSTPPPAAAGACADNFTRAWANPDLPPADWLAGLRRYSAPNFTADLATVDPTNVPAHTVTGIPTTVSSTTLVVTDDVPTDTGTLRVTCQQLAGQWLATAIEWRQPGP
jgi:hypothetical protein